MATKPWWEYAVTQDYNPPNEYGIDVATPQGTPLTALLGGRVTRTRYGPFGGEVDIQTVLPGSNKSYTEYFLHLDEINPKIQPGIAVQPGDFLGFSGGQLRGGAHPATSQYSSGPHTEFGIFEGAAWSGKSINPTGFLTRGAPMQQNSVAGNVFDQLAAQPGEALRNLLNEQGQIAGAVGAAQAAGYSQIAGALSNVPTQVGHGLADFFATSEANIAEWLKRQTVAFFVAAVVLLVLFL